MIILHAIWTDRTLHLWAETGAPETPGKKRRKAAKPVAKAGKKTGPIHPFAADAGAIREALPSVSSDFGMFRPTAATLTLRLPTAEARPLPSTPLLGQSGPGVSDQKPHLDLAEWTVPSLVFTGLEALDALTSLPAEFPSGFLGGDSLRYWMRAGAMAMELLVRQRFVPDFVIERGAGRAVWRALPDDDALGRMSQLSASCPPVCRAATDAAPEQLLREFIDSAVDAFVRDRLSGEVKKIAKHRKTAGTIYQQWLTALTSPDPTIKQQEQYLQAFRRDFNGWTEPLRSRDDKAFHACFRLIPPEDPETSDGWNLGFHLRAREDHSLMIEAAAVWQTQSNAAIVLKRRVNNPQELLLAELGKASRLFPPLERALESACPVGDRLTTGEAHRFLIEGAPLLEQAGFGVMAPPWWRNPSGQLGIKLAVRPFEKKEGSGLFGLESIVEFDWKIALGEHLISFDEFRRLASLKVPLVQVRGQWVEVRPDDIQKALKALQNQPAGQLTLGQLLRLGAGDGRDIAGLPVTGIEAEGWIADLLDPSADVAHRPGKQPKEFVGELRPYQLNGLGWLSFLDRFGLGGCLADDMGLGKTIQLIALLLQERENVNVKEKIGPTLILAPMSVVGNWQREIAKFAPTLSCLVHHGADRQAGKKFKKAATAGDVVISTYGLARRDREHLGRVNWRRVVLDEAQNIKNPAAKQTQAVRALPAGRRLALTGTPVENRLTELWSIMNFLNAGYLGGAEDFRKNYAVPVEKFGDQKKAGRLKTLVQPFLLRRLKTDKTIIKDLPEKQEIKVFCNLTKEQATLYAAVVKDMMAKIEQAEGIERHGQVLSAMMKLKQVCNHPAHFMKDNSKAGGRSGKLERLTEMLEETLENGERALVFTQFTEMGDILRPHLQERFGREALFLHGGVGQKARDEMVARFQDPAGGPPIFILSLKAGGVGLNLTAASQVFHFDRWWNPAVEDQATDRAYRIGQTRNVQVYKYVCAGTMEERIDQMIEKKKKLAQSVIGAGESWLTELSTEELRRVFELSAEAVGE
ncbi:DEAD/DEAH box helicase [candidate division TA06 bacterium]|uniref:DEAD/DEAH box helicase n=1 Tax=candidate division TA06 bacterium TaxID=2250710 RepID=A0A933I852_UNCT6|nr:DEAD/DEAH box helicase [candidate division TA06 bacterium]